jgi:hypothetical protein
LTPVAARHTLAGVDALKLMAALNPRGGRRRSTVLVVWHRFLIAGLEAPLPDLIERDGEDAAWFRSR